MERTRASRARGHCCSFDGSLSKSMHNLMFLIFILVFVFFFSFILPPSIRYLHMSLCSSQFNYPSNAQPIDTWKNVHWRIDIKQKQFPLQFIQWQTAIKKDEQFKFISASASPLTAMNSRLQFCRHKNSKKDYVSSEDFIYFSYLRSYPSRIRPCLT